jgi:hypothetical protein
MNVSVGGMKADQRYTNNISSYPVEHSKRKVNSIPVAGRGGP